MVSSLEQRGTEEKQESRDVCGRTYKGTGGEADRTDQRGSEGLDVLFRAV